MKCKILITDDQGNEFTGDVTLIPVPKGIRPRHKDMKIPKKDETPNFDMNIRAFIKKYSKGMSGQEKFALLLAYLVKGNLDEEKSLDEMKNYWSKLTLLFKGEFNYAYSVRAKDDDLVNSKRQGFYYLTQNWAKILTNERE